MLPPIRYPLPTLLALILGSLFAWQAAALSSGWRAEMAARVRRTLEGPPVPSSARPQVVAGPMTRRGLLLHDETRTTTRPNGPAAETIDRRMFVDVYDTWPSPGQVSHIRVGNRRAIGWVAARDLLEWDTRLVVRAPAGKLDLAETPGGPSQTVEVGKHVFPVLAWTEEAVEVATWDPANPWSTVARRGWVRSADLSAEVWGVWISQVELPILLGLANQSESPLMARLRAVLGRLADNRPWTAADIDAVKSALPGVVTAREPNAPAAAGRLAEVNAQSTSEASWSGLSFQFLPMVDLP